MSRHINKRTKGIVLTTLIMLVVVAAVFTVVANIRVNHAAKGLCYNSAEEIPHRRVGLLLGTSRFLRGGAPNPYFYNRIAACAELYHAGKIEKVLVSGDNSRKEYNEPEDMRQALVEAGVADSDIVLDYAGFRTYDSMVRAKRVFGQDRLTIISQQFHNERALYIASRIGVNAVAFNADNVDFHVLSTRVIVREWLARTKMSLDLVFMPDPHFLGEPIEI